MTTSDLQQSAVSVAAPKRMTPLKWLAHRRAVKALGSPATDQPVVAADQPVVMRDGTVLLTDLWAPAESGLDTPTSKPVFLARTPYGRDSAAPWAKALAARGHHVVVQSCRGHFGSGGTFDPFHDEARDGQDTVAWIESQPWFSGRIHTFGLSYLGLTQWALTDDLPTSVEAMTIVVSARSFRDTIMHHNGGFSLETALTWTMALDMIEGPLREQLALPVTGKARVARASATVPPREAIRTAVGRDESFYLDWVDHDALDPWWDPFVYGNDATQVPPVVLVAGWYDLFLTGGFEDFLHLRAAGRPARLVVGPWSHSSTEPATVALREAVSQADDLERAHVRAPITVQPIGATQLLTFTQWPPETARSTTYYCAADGSLAVSETGEPAVVGYRYDPTDPTPSVGGRSLNPWNSGPKNQKARESRSDVITFTTEPFGDDRTVAGDVEVHLRLASTNPTVDVFARLCVVDARGRSTNLTDEFLRLQDDGTPRGELGRPREVSLRLAPIAARIPAGARLRLQVSSGAHPLFQRNPGTPDPMHDFSRLIASDQEIHLGRSGSRIDIPFV